MAEPARELTIEVEVNVSERNPKFALQKLPFTFGFRGESRATTIISYNLDEMLGTKLRAMFQRSHAYDPMVAGEVVTRRLLNQLPA